MKTKTTTQTLEKFTQVQLIEAITNEMRDKKLSETNIKAATTYCRELAKRLRISDNAAMLFAAFFDNFTDSRICIEDIARFYDCNKVKILAYWANITELVKKQYINQSKDMDGDESYQVPNEVVESVRENKEYIPIDYSNLSLDQWIGHLCMLMDSKRRDRISFDKFLESLQQLIKGNQHLVIASEMAKIKEFDDLIIFAAMTNLYIQNNDEHIVKNDIEDYLEAHWKMREHARKLEAGIHPLQQAGLVEYSNSDGQAESDSWKLTNSAKERFLAEIATCHAEPENRHVQSPDSIIPKQLFFNPSVTRQVEQLESLLNAETFTKVQENLTKHGMRRGLACIFYGSPGTGKTETALQLARKTGRGIMMVDVPNLRDKWVGETEKNTKAIFERYRTYCNSSKLAPILLFNEADAILCKRKEGAENGVDKMENAMQNIILQEMETLDGIMIATTNLTGNLDTAFERRFLYKIEFPKPMPDESRHIWQNMLPELTEAEAYELAKQYSFSGGQIENIARKQFVNAVLFGTENVGMNAIRESCKSELFRGPCMHKMGF